MDSKVRQRYDASRNLEGKPFHSACYAPFVSLLMNTVGNVVACCRSQAYVLGNVTRESLDEIWNGPRLRAMRESLADYRFGPGCEFCEWMIDAGDHQGAVARHFDWYAIESSQPAFPKQMEFALANDCNFACIHCCGDWSSRIRTQREGLPPLARVYDDRFFASLERYIPHLEVAKFLGGEPFLVAENYRVWDLMIAAGARPRCFILTNGSQWNARVERVLEHLGPSICVSLDAIGDRELLEQIRVGARYDRIVANIQRFRAYSRARNLRMSISFSLMRQNWTELGPMLRFCEENDFDIEVIRVIEPSQFSLFSLPGPEMLQIADALAALTPSVRPGLSRLAGTWDSVVQSLRDNARKEQSAAYRHMHEVDSALRETPVELASRALARGDWNATLQAARQMPKTDKDYLYALLHMAHAHRQLDQLDASQKLLDEALTLTGRQAAVFVERAWLRFAQGRHDDGIHEANQALAVAPSGAEGDQQRGFARDAIACLAARGGQSAVAASAVTASG